MWRLSITDFQNTQPEVVFDVAIPNWMEAYQWYSEKAGKPKQLSANSTCLFNQTGVIILDHDQHETCRMRSELSADMLDVPKYSLTEYIVVEERQQERSVQSSISAKEKVFVMQSGTKEEQGEFFLREQLDQIQKEWTKSDKGQFVNLMIFDHLWKEKPVKPPLVVLQWKDWSSQVAIEFPLREGFKFLG